MGTTLADQIEVAAGIATGISRYAAGLGLEVDPIARACGLDPERFAVINERISLDRLCRYLEALALISGDDVFGLQSITSFEKGASGPFGYGLMNAANLREFLMFFGRNMQKISETRICTSDIGARSVHFEWTYSPLILHRDQYVDMGTAQTFIHLRALLGEDINQVRLELERNKPINTSLHKQLLTQNVRFNAPINTMILPAEFLERINPEADPQLFSLMSQQMDAMPLRRTDASDPLIAIRLHVAENLSFNTPTLASEAKRLGMSSRTLQRRLTDAGTSMRTIIDECRKEMANRLLLETTHTISSIGYELGFSAPAAFTRSATRWFNMTPSQYRAQNHEDL